MSPAPGRTTPLRRRQVLFHIPPPHKVVVSRFDSREPAFPGGHPEATVRYLVFSRGLSECEQLVFGLYHRSEDSGSVNVDDISIFKLR